MNPKLKWLLAWGSGILLIDQFTKYLIDRMLPVGARIPVLTHFVDLVHYRNPGAAFSLFADWESPWREVFFFGISAVALILLSYYLVKTPLGEKKTLIPLVMILAGALGNLIDRLIRGNVIDFLFLHWYDKTASFQLFGRPYHIDLSWPAFNVADSVISVGVVFLLLGSLRSPCSRS